MTQAAIEIWTVSLLVATIFFLVIIWGAFSNIRRKARYLSYRRERMFAHDRNLDDREEQIAFREGLLRKETENRKPVSASVFLIDEDIDEYGNSFRRIARKKLAQRIGYKVVSLYKADIKETRELNGIMFKIEVLTSKK